MSRACKTVLFLRPCNCSKDNRVQECSLHGSLCFAVDLRYCKIRLNYPSPAHPEAFWWRLPVPSLLPTCPAFLPGSLCGVGGRGRARFLPPSQSLCLGRRCPAVKFCPPLSCSCVSRCSHLGSTWPGAGEGSHSRRVEQRAGGTSTPTQVPSGLLNNSNNCSKRHEGWSAFISVTH